MFYNIIDTVPERPVGNTDNLYFVLDGGSLLHRVVWPKQETFGDVYTTYMSYIKRHYGDEVTVVFDGYTESSVNTKRVRVKSKIGSIDLKICRILILGSNAKKSILFVHAISGYDATSGFYGKGKLQEVQLFNLSKYLQDIPEIFDNPKSTYIEIERGGERFIIVLYSNKKKEEDPERWKLLGFDILEVKEVFDQSFKTI
ncbi:hypothetical protein AVEN_214705-1 [Araneus ventricosus]|uniref:Uncharacterized protein n=1 Tax=Araneus ventricosus TaxID=182803 RepID=A0A4Y2HDM1_ARAVE|nr:hypothetical protein AVEN_104853-1 [Araneus ventricosus]GBM63369.1 hypothetical protein AVEN_214705-1 [Araneus ventricosus]